MSISKALFGTLSSGEDVHLYTITNSQGASVDISTLGCAIVSLRVPDRHGRLDDVVLGYDTPGEYRQKPKFIGVVIGRYGNRIAHGTCSLDGRELHLERNSNGHSLHGGSKGFDKKVWRAADTGEDFITLEMLSPHGDGGYPGNLQVRLTYTFDDSCTLRLHYHAVSDRRTLCNLTHHCYFNLAGHQTGSIAEQEIQVNAEQVLEIDGSLIPTGKYRSVSGTPLDLRRPVSFGSLHAQIGKDPLLSIGKGVDLNYIPLGEGFRPIASVYDPKSGRRLEVSTDMPGVQVYSGGNLTGEVFGKGGTPYPQHGGFCLETQFFPDSPHHPAFPSAELPAGVPYDHTTTYQFTVSGDGHER